MVRTVVEEVHTNLQEKLFEMDGHGEPKKLKSLGILLKLILFSGFLPPPSISTVPWKLFIYDFLTALELFSFIPQFTLQIMAMCEYRNDFQIITSIMFQILLFSYCLFAAAYFVFYRSRLGELLQSLETRFVPHIKKIELPTKHLSIIKAGLRQANIMGLVLLTVMFFVCTDWGLVPAIKRYFDILTSSRQELIQSLVPKEAYKKYFGIIIWLPSNVDEFPIYELLALIDAIAIYVVGITYAATGATFLIFMINISTHFKIITSSIESVDEMFPQTYSGDVPDDEEDDDVGNTQATFNILSLDEEICGSPLQGPVELSSGQMEHQGRENSTNNVSGRKIITRNNEQYTTTEHIREEAAEQTQNAPSDEERLYQYLTECVKYHQSLLEYTADIDKFLSPIFLYFFLTAQINISLSVFQTVLGLGGGNLKFISSIFTNGLYTFMFCWFGEYLTAQSLTVNYAAFNCRWYNHSTKTKKLLQMMIMRAQNPVRLSVGKFYNLSLETFSDIANKVYAFSTVLRNMVEE